MMVGRGKRTENEERIETARGIVRARVFGAAGIIKQTRRRENA